MISTSLAQRIGILSGDMSVHADWWLCNHVWHTHHLRAGRNRQMHRLVSWTPSQFIKAGRSSLESSAVQFEPQQLLIVVHSKQRWSVTSAQHLARPQSVRRQHCPSIEPQAQVCSACVSVDTGNITLSCIEAYEIFKIGIHDDGGSFHSTAITAASLHVLVQMSCLPGRKQRHVHEPVVLNQVDGRTVATRRAKCLTHATQPCAPRWVLARRCFVLTS